MSLFVANIEDQEKWNGLLGGLNPKTFLQSWEWGEVQKRLGHKVWRVGVYEEKDLLGLSLIVKITARRGSFLFCPHGPLVFNPALTPSMFLTLKQYLIPLAKKEKCSFLRWSTLLPKTEESDHLFKELGFRPAPIHLMHPELAWILDLHPSEEELLKNMRKSTRYSIRKAEKDGVQIESSKEIKDLDIFWKVYQETVEREEFAPFSPEYFRVELEVFLENNQALLFFARYQGEVVGTAFIIFTNSGAFYHHGASSRKFSQLTASHLLQWEVIKEAKKRNCDLYNFWGIAPPTAKHHPWAGLSLFKTGFGGYAEEYAHARDFVLDKNSYRFTYLIERWRRLYRRL